MKKEKRTVYIDISCQYKASKVNVLKITQGQIKIIRLLILAMKDIKLISLEKFIRNKKGYQTIYGISHKGSRDFRRLMLVKKVNVN